MTLRTACQAYIKFASSVKAGLDVGQFTKAKH